MTSRQLTLIDIFPVIVDLFIPAFSSLTELIILQEPEKLRERQRTDDELRKTEPERLEESDDFINLVECFQRNSKESTCPNAAKGIFVNFQEARDMFGHLEMFNLSYGNEF